MDVNEQRLFDLIKETVSELNKELEEVNGTGIYFAPELYVAFSIGKEIARRKDEIFRVKNVFWGRERDLKNGGPSDIVFEQKFGKNKKVISVIELKLRDKYDAYKADIEKLIRLDLPECRRYFCVLLDSFTKSNDERLLKLESEYSENISRIDQSSFEVNQDWYKKQVYCVLNLYEVVS